jgi:hypothetical protein
MEIAGLKTVDNRVETPGRVVLRDAGAHGSALAMAVTVMVAIACVGCETGGSSSLTAHVSGTVTIGGEPVPDDAEGSITFRPLASGSGRAVTVPIENGKYDSRDVPKGKVMAVVNIVRPSGRTYVSDRDGREIEEKESIVPADKAGGIDMEVTGSNAEWNFDL